jgi:hypothetical protein
MCYPRNMKAKKSRRAGATETFSVSVDPETKRALRALADKEFGGSLSALVTDFAEDARRRLAAGAYLRRHRIPELAAGEADRIETEINREVANARTRTAKDACSSRSGDGRRSGSYQPWSIPLAVSVISTVAPPSRYSSRMR